MAEIWDVYDKFRRKTGDFIVRGAAIPTGLKHLVVHMIYYNCFGEILIQKRSAKKDLAPGVWAFTGGSALAGENSYEACFRETVEEMGFEPDMSEAELILSYTRKDSFTDVYLIKADIAADKLILQDGEVDEVRWVNRAAFEELLNTDGVFWKYSYLPVVTKYLVEMKYLK